MLDVQNYTFFEKINNNHAHLEYEKTFWAKGYQYIIGIDEVGRGSWAGPLVACGVILPCDFIIPNGLRDSKLVPERQREKLAKVILKKALAVSTGEVNSNYIDKYGLTEATQKVFRKVVITIGLKPDYYLIDAFYLNFIPKKIQSAIRKGDRYSASIAAASIVAKVYRDNLMKKFDEKFPMYGFSENKGYGTSFHRRAISRFGYCAIHRKSYSIS